MKINIFSVIFAANVCMFHCKHLIIGEFKNLTAIFHTVAKVEFHGMSCARKVKKVSYDDYKGRVILGLVAYDNLQSKATVTILKGGIGYTHIVLRLRSERGWGLDYDIAVYALDRDRLTTTTTTTTPKPTTTQQPRLNINKRRLEIKSQYIKTLKEVPSSVI